MRADSERDMRKAKSEGTAARGARAEGEALPRKGRMERGDAEMAARGRWACLGKGTVPWWCFDIKCIAQNDMTFSCVIYLFLIDLNP